MPLTDFPPGEYVFRATMFTLRQRALSRHSREQHLDRPLLRSSSSFFVVAIALCLSVTPRSAHASGAAAEALFEAGVTARDSGDYATACEKFQASNDLDPATGTILNLADCREQLGQVASAWQLYREAAEKLPSGDDRAGYARDKAKELEARLPRVTLRWEDSAASGDIYLDDEKLPANVLGVALPIDPGAHTYQVRAADHETKDFPLSIKEGEAKELVLSVGAPLAAAAPVDEGESEPEVADEADAGPNRTLRTVGFVGIGVGAAALIAGGVTGLMAMDRAKTVDDECDQDFCRTQEGKDAADQGRTLSAISTATFIAGAVLAGAGVTLVVLSSKKKSESAHAPSWDLGLAPRAGGAALSFKGAF